MMYYTSYFSNPILKTIDNSLLRPITYKLPSWSKYVWYPQFAPSEKLVKQYKSGWLDESEYYGNVLRFITKEEVIDTLPDESVLLCFEKPPKFCHRHLVSEWLNSVGLECKEL